MKFADVCVVSASVSCGVTFLRAVRWENTAFDRAREI